ncbi:cupin domain-containing protein [Archangium violaceum]|uniref:cupin domain-containing protein n=1 Tax=Archangium violaceum TaxID=83451 RepID=UPI00193BDD0C|nr:cupin domain-containing protein [Archangium violaceum]QRK06453.1 cupin domain-containing protein [Archangium violaceum]
MREGLIIGDLEDPSVVYGVHGTRGLSQWKCLARRAGLFGAWEAVEWAWIPPGGVSGEHVHTRTEEIYFILSGRGEMTLDGKRHPVGPGNLILTGLGTTHGLRNVGDEGLGWLVIEVMSPATAAALRGSGSPDVPSRTQTQRGGSDVPNAVVLNLRQTYEVNPRTVFTGPLRSIRLVDLKPGQRAELSAEGEEHTLFALRGSGEISSGGATVPLKYGVSVTLPLGTGMSVTAGEDGLEYFLASLEVPGGGAR